MERVRRKITFSITMSPLLLEKMDKSIEEHDYSGRSDLASIAIAEHLIKEDLELMDQSISLFLSHFLSDNHSRQQLRKITPDNIHFRISALKKKAKACIELGEFDEARECLEEAKKLEATESPEQKPRIITYDSQKEKEECLKSIEPEPRELTPEEARKAAEAKEYYKAFLDDEEEETVTEQLKKDKATGTTKRRVGLK